MQVVSGMSKADNPMWKPTALSGASPIIESCGSPTATSSMRRKWGDDVIDGTGGLFTDVALLITACGGAALSGAKAYAIVIESRARSLRLIAYIGHEHNQMRPDLEGPQDPHQ